MDCELRVVDKIDSLFPRCSQGSASHHTVTWQVKVDVCLFLVYLSDTVLFTNTQRHLGLYVTIGRKMYISGKIRHRSGTYITIADILWIDYNKEVNLIYISIPLASTYIA